eukprot:gnl/TRDRNA2_/TRDRNA2_171202_c1_seq3.p1 gnl/TRDRNA2_/TRDRNA2_171202_c1~~gnl/TRDRNA2_/TRDRNA2_171202_c1_seq3.p1  ORF type:complete len:647 (+),score=95.09 gnl/TRDRNA2_/TRDRNA2_171202_c1_seq3:237-1943(+)
MAAEHKGSSEHGKKRMMPHRRSKEHRRSKKQPKAAGSDEARWSAGKLREHSVDKRAMAGQGTAAAAKPGGFSSSTTTRKPTASSKAVSATGSAFREDGSIRTNYANQVAMQNLYDKILGPQSGYNPQIRPVPECSVYDCSHRINAWLGVGFTKMLGVDEQKNQVKMLGIMTVRWPDFRLDYDASEHMPKDLDWNSLYDGLAVNPDLLWIPDIQLSNAAAPTVQSFRPSAHLYDSVKRKKDGYNVEFQVPVALTVKCNLVMDDFPFDKHSCPFFFQSWSASTKWIILEGIKDPPVLMASGQGLSEALSDKNEEFDLQYINMTMGSVGKKGDENHTFAEVVYTVNISRFSHYYMCVIILPMSLMIIFSLGVFFIDPERGERLGVSMTLLLTVMAMSFFVADSLPKSGGGDTWLQEFQAVSYVLTMFPLFVSLSQELLRRIYLQSEKNKQEPGAEDDSKHGDDEPDSDWIDFRVDHILRLPYALCTFVFMGWVLWKYVVTYKQDEFSVQIMLVFLVMTSLGLLSLTIFELYVGYASGDSSQDDFNKMKGVVKDRRSGTKSQSVSQKDLDAV